MHMSPRPSVAIRLPLRQACNNRIKSPWAGACSSARPAARPFHLPAQPRGRVRRPSVTHPFDHHIQNTTLLLLHPIPRRASSSSASSTRWRARQAQDSAAKAAKVAGLKSRAAWKLLELDERHRLFRPGSTVVDLGFAPGSWAQVAAARTRPGGRVVGLDVLPAMPPPGVSTLQGDFLSPAIREEVRRFVLDPMRGRPRMARSFVARGDEGVSEEELEEQGRGLLERERREGGEVKGESSTGEQATATAAAARSQSQLDRAEGRVVDVVLSDMSEPWPQTASTWLRSVSNPYRRMMNTSGMAFRDHAGSMVSVLRDLFGFDSASTLPGHPSGRDLFHVVANTAQDLCFAALTFCYDTLVTGGHFLCKFYDGAEAHAFELRLKKLFDKVHRSKPDASRKESKEAYFVGLRRKPGVPRDVVLGDPEGG